MRWPAKMTAADRADLTELFRHRQLGRDSRPEAPGYRRPSWGRGQ